MSGLEIAGVVLAAFPLILSGLENFRRVSNAGKNWWEIRRRYQRCLRVVEYHQVWYIENLTALLYPIVNDSERLKALIGDPGGPDWRSEDLQEGLIRRLPHTLKSYEGIMTDLNDTLEEIKKELGIHKRGFQERLKSPPKAGLPNTFSRDNLEYFLQRLKFGIGESAREKLFHELKTCNKRLQNLLSISEKAVEQQTQITTSVEASTASSFRKIWKRADQLFRAIAVSCGCECREKHVVNLLLEHRIDALLKLEIVLAFGENLSGKQAELWSPQELWFDGYPQKTCSGRDVSSSETMQNALQSLSCNSCTNSNIVIPSTGQQVPRPTPKDEIIGVSRRTCEAGPSNISRNDRRVTFADPPRAFSAELPIVRRTSDPVNLCRALTSRTEDSCLGILYPSGNVYHVHPFERRTRKQMCDMLDLDAILSSAYIHDLGLGERLGLAFTLASSFAQLQQSPWLGSTLTKKEIRFFVDDSGLIDPRQPFVRKRVPAKDDVGTTAGSTECNFLCLGILFLELYFGSRLEDLEIRRAMPPGEGKTKEALDLMAALEWRSELEDKAAPEYAEAVSWCFARYPKERKDDRWRNKFLESVIAPLELCHISFKEAESAFQV